MPTPREQSGALSEVSRLLQEGLQLLDDRTREVDALVKRWLAEGALADAKARRLADRLENLSAIYQQHIVVEDAQVFPLADHVLPQAEIAEIGREMAARRGINLTAIACVVSEPPYDSTP